MSREKGFTLLEILIVISILAILGVAVMPFIVGKEYPARATTTRTNLETLRSCISMYYAKTGQYPTDDLSTLVTAQFNEGGKIVTYLPEIPLELMSSPKKESAEKNPPNRRVTNSLGTEGGWFYDIKTGRVYVNYNTTLPDVWGDDLKGENPSKW